MLTSIITLLLASLASAQIYTVHNLCPTAIDLYIAGNFETSLPKGAKITKTGLGPDAGFFYTTTNGGLVNGALVAARAGFYFEPNYWYYYLVKDANHFNTGINVTPNQAAHDGFCSPAVCNDGNCTTAYTSPPVFHSPIPPPANSPAPNPPLFQCKVPGANFDITFCPSGNWPQVRGAQIFPNFNPRKCLDVRGAVFANGTPVQIYDCNDTPAQRWFINHGSTKVQLANTNFCLDAGSSPANGVKMKIWQCYDNLPAQKWFFTDDSRIALEGKGLCLDLPSGNLANANQLQTWTCTDFNLNQVWGL